MKPPASYDLLSSEEYNRSMEKIWSMVKSRTDLTSINHKVALYQKELRRILNVYARVDEH
ncbi:MAG: hypothetical protein ABDH32_04895 [Candidatus Caldarchaeales archaeon]